MSSAAGPNVKTHIWNHAVFVMVLGKSQFCDRSTTVYVKGKNGCMVTGISFTWKEGRKETFIGQG
jgi:hypothetical protein